LLPSSIDPATAAAKIVILHQFVSNLNKGNLEIPTSVSVQFFVQQ